LARYPSWAQGTRSSQRINELLAIVGGDRYLEIGVEAGYTLEGVRARVRIAVEPRPRFRVDRLPSGVTLHPMPSDRFFDTTPPTSDLNGAFIDGLHEHRQTYRDLVATLERLLPGGFILLDDVVPIDEAAGLPSEEEFLKARARTDSSSGAWMGDVWRVVIALNRCHGANLDWRTVTARNGRMQTLIWRRPGVAFSEADPSALAALSDVAYDDVFASGIPPAFRPAAWSDAVSAFITSR